MNRWHTNAYFPTLAKRPSCPICGADVAWLQFAIATDGGPTMMTLGMVNTCDCDPTEMCRRFARALGVDVVEMPGHGFPSPEMPRPKGWRWQLVKTKRKRARKKAALK